MTKRRDVVRLLEENGFKKAHGTNHEKFVKGGHTVAIPRHKEIKENTFKEIKKQAGLK